MRAINPTFYKKDLEHVTEKGVKKVEAGVLHFKCTLPSGVAKVDDSEFDDRATEQHKKDYAKAYAAFVESEVAE